MKRFAHVVGLLLVAGCAGRQGTPAPEPQLGSAPPAKSAVTTGVLPTPATGDIPPAPVLPPAPAFDTHIDAEIRDELKVSADSVADAEMLERLAAARPTVRDDATTPDLSVKSPGGGVTWDIDVASFNSHDRVQYYLDLFQGPARERMGIWLNRMPRYETMIRQRLQEQGLPGDMVYLALIESGFSNVATSRARAVGMWQFMRGTGRGYGLRVDGWVDERRDPFKATVAATRFLRDLQKRFGSLYLAAAAYNAGAGKVGRGLNRMADDESDDADSVYSDSTFFRLYDTDFIRRETKDYVPKLIAAALIAKEPERYGFHITASDALETDSIVVPDMTGLDVIARLADTTVAAIAELNPQYLRLATPPHTRSIVRLPAGRGPMTAAAYSILPVGDRVSFLEHVVARKETTRSIAARYGVPASALVEANPALRRRAPKAGQHLIVPIGGAMSTLVARRIAEPEPTVAEFHKVRRGETVAGIASRFDIPQKQLRQWNRLGPKSRVRVGQRLRVSAPPAQRARQAAGKAVPARRAPHAASATHVVAKGETLTGLARRYHVSVQALRAANGMSARAQLRAGSSISIPR